MTVCVLRVSGCDTEVSKLKAALDLNITLSWNKGDSDRKGTVLDSSGFNADVAEAESGPELVEEVMKFISKCQSSNVSFASENLDAELSFGLFVGSPESHTSSIEFSSRGLSKISSLGLTLSVSAYPISEE